MKNNIVKNAFILFTVTFIAGILLGFAHELTKEPIEKQIKLEKTKAFQTVFKAADKFDSLDVKKDTIDKINIEEINEAKKSNETIGYVFVITTKEGYSGSIKIAVGMKKDTTITAIDIMEMSETPGLGAKADENSFKDQFNNKQVNKFTVVKSSSATDEEIDAIGGATITSKAVTNAVNKAIEYYQNNLSKEGA